MVAKTRDVAGISAMTTPELEAHLHGQAETVRVKALEWERITEQPMFKGDEPKRFWRAADQLGGYVWVRVHTADFDGECSFGSDKFTTAADAKIAFEGHRASRILSTIEAGPGEALRLREIISECAAALGNGAAIAPSCSLEFMANLPEEIRLVVSRLPPIGGEAEPVAWRREPKGTYPADITDWEEISEVWSEDGFVVTPLFAAPQGGVK